MHRDTEHFRDLSSPRETLGALPALQPGWTQHLAWKTSACALGTGCTCLFFFFFFLGPESSRQKKQLAQSLA